MLFAIDVHYRETEAKIVGFLFDWDDIEPQKTFIEFIHDIEDYVSGEFYKRELPCLLKIIEKIKDIPIEAIIVDGNIYVSNDYEYGLGGKLWESLNGETPIIGVAKTSFYKNKETVKEVYRGISSKPLYISTIGYNIDDAVEKIKKMNGEYRFPKLLKDLDSQTKN